MTAPRVPSEPRSSHACQVVIQATCPPRLCRTPWGLTGEKPDRMGTPLAFQMGRLCDLQPVPANQPPGARVAPVFSPEKRGPQRYRAQSGTWGHCQDSAAWGLGAGLSTHLPLHAQDA